MGNYPYAQDLFGKGLPAWPLKVACEVDQVEPLEFLAKAVGSYYNATGEICDVFDDDWRLEKVCCFSTQS